MTTKFRFKLLFTLLALSGCAQLATASTVARSSAVVCCTVSEIQTIGDLNYLARAALNHTGEYKDRLYTLAMQLKAGTWRQWSDPDRGYILGLMAATPDGKYWRSLLDSFAAELGVSIKNVTIPTPSPVVVPSTPPTPASATLDTAVIRAIIVAEIAKLPAQPFNGVVDKLIVRGKLCVVEPPYATDCNPDKTEVVQIRQANGAAIGFEANMNNAWRQGDTPPEGTGAGYGIVGMSPDLGLRICQNQAWAVSGYKEFISPTKGKGCAGYDSQAQWSFNFLRPGETDPKTQQMVLVDNGFGIGWNVWRPDRKACLVASSFKYAMDRVLCTQ